MKKFLVISMILALLAITQSAIAQEGSPKFTMNGGVWAGMNKNTSFIGFMGPKVTITFSVSENMKLEAGLNGVPGLILDNNPRLGLTAGATITIKHSKTKMKPVLGVMMLKTTKWQPLFGAGILF